MPYLLRYPFDDEEIRPFLLRILRRMRWPEYAALERQFGLAALPPEPRVCGLHLAQRIRMHLGRLRWAAEGRGGPPLPLSYAPYDRVLGRFLPRQVQADFLDAIHRLAEAADAEEAESLFERATRLVM